MKTKILTIVLISMAVLVSGFISYNTSLKKEDKPIHQLRIYEIPKDNLQVFHNRFRDHAHRIMKKYDFEIVSIWESKTKNKVEFVYLLEWKDEATMKDRWAKFMLDQEWKDIKKETSKVHGKFVENIEDRSLILTAYSPQKKFLKN